MKCHVKLSPNYFSVNVSVLAVLFRRKISGKLKNNEKHLKTIKNAKKLSVFGKNDSRSLFNLLQTHIFLNFNHNSRTYNQINYRNIWFTKVIIILFMTAQVLFAMFFLKKTRTLMLLSYYKSKNLDKIALFFLLFLAS